MNQELQHSLDDNAKAWLALSLSIASSEKLSFDKIHDKLFDTYGSNFMSHVYRTAFEKMLQNMPDAERSKLLQAFGDAVQEAVDRNLYVQPSAAQCNACHSRSF